MTGLELPYPFDRDFMQLALLAGLVVGACAPLMGTFLVQRRLSLVGDGLGHVAFAGVSLGLLTGTWPIWTALAAAVMGALLIEWMRSRNGGNADFALAVLFYSGIAGGVVLAGLAGSLNAGALTYLFGSVLTVTVSDVAVVASIGLVTVLVMAISRHALLAIALDEDSARIARIPVRSMNFVLACLTAVTVVAGMRVVGVLLVAALMVLPAGAAQALGKSFKSSLFLGSCVGMFSVVVGLMAARFWGLAPGGTIVLVSAAIYLLAVLVRRR